MPNNFSYFAIFAWPVVVFFLFRAFPRVQALVASIVGGYLLLPSAVGINPPMLPTIDKTLVPALSAFLMCHLTSDSRGRRRIPAPVDEVAGQAEMSRRGDRYRKERMRGNRRRGAFQDADEKKNGKKIRDSRLFNFLILLLIITPFLTVAQNLENYVSGPLVISGLRIYDAFSFALTSLVSVMPYILARQYISREKEQELLLYGICIAGLLYSLPTLFEIRMSPQLSKWTYGFLSQSFVQARRGDSFRPVVYLHHGLWLAIFMAMATIAAFSAWRVRRRFSWFIGGLWVFGTLLLSSSLGALALALLFLPVAILFSIRTQLLVAAAFAAIIVTYPLLRGAGLVPVDGITEIASSISEERAKSFAFRIKNEDMLLDHANNKPIAGWGRFGRNLVYDQVTGRNLSITDGAWIIIVGTSGWLGYIASYGLLSLPIFLLYRRRRQLNIGFATSGLCLVLIVNLVDTIPNGTITPLTWLIAGALAGRSRVTEPSIEAAEPNSRSNRMVRG